MKKLNLLFKPGYSLVEFLMYFALISIFLIVLTQMFVSILEVQTESEATSSVDLDGRFILARLIYDISRSTTVTTPQNPGNSSSSLLLVIGGANFTYSESGGAFVLTNNLGAGNLNSSETQISALNFTKLGEAGGKETIKFTFTLSSRVQRPSGPEVKTFGTTVERR
ncbi:MAG: hypothetical protein NUV69_01400 [Candidatus Curtissbacteria bacterium]|nr:hypothetical protein [Candidatus Curtissbacteria bacterium]